MISRFQPDFSIYEIRVAERGANWREENELFKIVFWSRQRISFRFLTFVIDLDCPFLKKFDNTLF